VRTNLSVDDLGDLLSLPIVGTLATYRKSGDVLLSPVWFEWADGGFNVVVGRNDVKAQHLRRDARASVAPPNGAATKAEISTMRSPERIPAPIGIVMLTGACART